MIASNLTVCLTVLTILTAVVLDVVNGEVREIENRLFSQAEKKTDKSCFTCHIKRLEPTFSDNDVEWKDDFFSCIVVNETGGYREIIDIVLPKDFVEEHHVILETERAYFCIPFQFIKKPNRSIVVPVGSGLQPMEVANRELMEFQRSGTFRLLAVRVLTTSGEEPVETSEEIEGAIFGTGTNPAVIPDATILSQYSAVSHNALTFTPASGPGIYNGVAQITMNRQITGAQIQSDLMSDILAHTAMALGPLDTVTDRIIFCLPDGSALQGSDSWTAFTYLYEPYSFYQQSRCIKLSVAMHEVGHSFGFRHSGWEADEYGDQTGYMGYAVNVLGHPQKAFNAHKHWISGWFVDKAKHIDPWSERSYHGKLVSFVDYSNYQMNEEDAVLLRVGELYIQYNVAKGYNIDNPSSHKVVITYADESTSVSRLQAELTTGDRFIYQYNEGNATTRGNSTLNGYSLVNGTIMPNLIIQVCSLMTGPYDFALISIHIEDGYQVSQCNLLSALTPTNFQEITPPPFRNFGDGYSVTVSADDDIFGPEKRNDGILIVENGHGRISENPSKRELVTLSVVWTIVGLLTVVACVLLYRYKHLGRVDFCCGGFDPAKNMERNNSPDSDQHSQVAQILRSTTEESVSSLESGDAPISAHV